MNNFSGRSKMWGSNSAPPETTEKVGDLKEVGTSMSAISFGFVATAILVAMFLIMAIFEHLLRPKTPIPVSQNMQLADKLEANQAQKIGNLRSVLMPGNCYPTYIAKPVPLPCQREGISWPAHEHHSFSSP